METMTVKKLASMLNSSREFSATGRPIENTSELTYLLQDAEEYVDTSTGKKYCTGKLFDTMVECGAKMEKTGKKKKRKDFFCKVFYIPKRSGGSRRIIDYDANPSIDGGWYKKLLDGLLCVLNQMIGPEIPDYLVGCKTGASLAKTGMDIYSKMSRTGFIGHLDVVQWFDSIKATKIREALETSGHCDKTSAWLLSELLTYSGSLPQGSPCSPIMANFIALKTWGPEISEYGKKNELTVYIYVDNIVIVFPEHMNRKEATAHIVAMSNILSRFHYTGHKASVMHPSQKQKVLGMILNKTPFRDSPRVPKSMKKRMRGIIKNIERNGFLSETKKWVQNFEGYKYKAHSDKMQKLAFKRWLIGQLSWAMQIEGPSSELTGLKARLLFFFCDCKK